jgi:GMP synthase (glutamine-hydrolysing)
MSAHPSMVTVVQHLAFENLGSFAQPLREMGHVVRYVQAGVDDVAQAIDAAELLVVLGGPIGAYETDRYPFLIDELAALARRLVARRPTLGICLGAQLIAKALGAAVYPGGRKEIGWGELQLPPAGLQSPLRSLEGVRVLHWHGDTFDLPKDAELLASSAAYPHQAFRVGSNVLALQFHPEALTQQFECWLIGHTQELAAAGVDVPTLRLQARTQGPLLEQASQAMLKAWLADLDWP